MGKFRRNSDSSQSLFNQQGFTIVEILVTLSLVALVVAFGLSDTFSNSDEDLDQEVAQLQRAIGFMSDEAALRNSVVRLHLFLDKSPQEYAVEYGPSDSFILPPAEDFETTTISEEEAAVQQKKIKEVNMKFNRIKEFQESNLEIDEDVRIIGFGTSTSKRLVDSAEAAIYAFPTGEKDDSIIILATDEKAVAIEIDAFGLETRKEVHKIENISNRDILIVQKEKAKQIFEDWLKQK